MTFLAGQIPTAAELQAIASIGTLTTWTPTWTAVTLGTGAVNEGRYCVINDLAVVWFRLQLGTSGGFSGTIQMDLPVTALTGGGTGLQATLGAWTFRDSSATKHWSGSIGIWSSAGTSISFNGAWSGSAPDTRINATSPVAAAVDDVLSGTCVFPVA